MDCEPLEGHTRLTGMVVQFPSPTTALAIALAASFVCAPAAAQQLQRGTIIDPVRCADDPAQTYALFLPSTYSPERQWSLLFAFHPAARGRLMVEKYQAAAEQYGYIIAASNNARNGPHAVSAAAAQAMSVAEARRRVAVMSALLSERTDDCRDRRSSRTAG